MHMSTHHAYGELPDQFGELRTPANSHARPLVVLVHGGFWRDQYHCDLMHPLAESLYDAGYASWNIEYRRVGPTGGGYPSTLTDVRAGIDHGSQVLIGVIRVGRRSWSSAIPQVVIWHCGTQAAPMPEPDQHSRLGLRQSPT